MSTEKTESPFEIAKKGDLFTFLVNAKTLLYYLVLKNSLVEKEIHLFNLYNRKEIFLDWSCFQNDFSMFGCIPFEGL